MHGCERLVLAAAVSHMLVCYPPPALRQGRSSWTRSCSGHELLHCVAAQHCTMQSPQRPKPLPSGTPPTDT